MFDGVRIRPRTDGLFPIIGATAYVTRGTRPFQLWGLSWGPSVFGPLQLLQLFLLFFTPALWEAKFKGEAERTVNIYLLQTSAAKGGSHLYTGKIDTITYA